MYNIDDLKGLNNKIVKSIFNDSKQMKINMELYNNFSNYVLPVYNMSNYLPILYTNNIFTSCMESLIEDVFKDYRVIGKYKNKVNKVEKFLTSSGLVEQLRQVFEDERSMGYGCLIVRRDNNLKITNFYHMPSKTVAIIRGTDGELKLVQYGVLTNRTYNFFGTKERGVDEILFINKYNPVDPFFGVSPSLPILGDIEVLDYLDSNVLGAVLKSNVRPQILAKVKTLNEESDVNQTELNKVRDDLEKRFNDGFSEANAIVASLSNKDIVIEIDTFENKNNVEGVLKVADYLKSNILQSFGMSPYRIGVILQGTLNGGTARESLEAYGFNTVLNNQRRYERIINEIISDFLGDGNLGSVEIEFERFKVDYTEVVKDDDLNEAEVKGEIIREDEVVIEEEEV